MQNLLNSDDLLAEPRVKAAAEAMGIRLHKVEIISRCCPGHNELVMKSLADVAFEMRDACDRITWVHMLGVIKGGYTPSVLTMARNTATEWIIAAVKAFEVKQ